MVTKKWMQRKRKRKKKKIKKKTKKMKMISRNPLNLKEQNTIGKLCSSRRISMEMYQCKCAKIFQKLLTK